MSLNKQEKRRNGKIVGRGIQWCNATYNPVGGCFHGCRWIMPDGSIATCYAEDVAKKFKSAYPDGFGNHYWRPHILNDPLKYKEPG